MSLTSTPYPDSSAPFDQTQNGCVICVFNDDGVVPCGDAVTGGQVEEFRAEAAALCRSRADWKLSRDPASRHHMQSVGEEIRNPAAVGGPHLKSVSFMISLPGRMVLNAEP